MADKALVEKAREFARKSTSDSYLADMADFADRDVAEERKRIAANLRNVYSNPHNVPFAIREFCELEAYGQD